MICFTHRLAAINNRWPLAGFLRITCMRLPTSERMREPTRGFLFGEDMKITADKLREILDYDQYTGIFTWKNPGTKFMIGREAGSWDCYGYKTVRINNKSYKTHRLAWLYVYGVWPQHDIDHINGNRADNRIENLRDVTRKINLENQAMLKNRSNKTGLMGSYYDIKKKKYYSRISQNDKSLYLGSFDTAEEAHNAYIEAKKLLHKGFIINRN